MTTTKDGLTIFKQFGMKSQTPAGDHVIGRCPLCGKEEHFFVNIKSDNKTWDCKVCGRAGGYLKFLEEIVNITQKTFSGPAAKALSENRGISVETFKSMHIGYHIFTKQYLIPVYGLDNRLVNIKLYDFQSMRNVAGCAASMYGLNQVSLKTATEVMLCEGEWDTLAMIEIIKHAGLERTVAVGVPGAGTFKTNIIPALADKNIYLLYDNDMAGYNGMEKAAKLLAPVAKRVFSIKWPEGTPEGYDVRDFYNYVDNDAQRAHEDLMSWVELVEADEAIEGGAGGGETELEDCEPIPCQEVYDVYQKWLHIPDTSLLDVIFGTVLANRLDGDPLWMFIVAPPGGTKTEAVLPLTGGVKIDTVSTLTPHTLISGANFGGGSDPSLIPKLNGKILIIKDFTSVLDMPFSERDEIFGILRDAYDGECKKPFGNGIIRSYKSKFGIIACVTPVIEQFTEDHAALGERFLRWRNYIPEGVKSRRVYIERAWNNTTHEVQMRAELSDIAKRVLRTKYEHKPNVPDKMVDRLISLAQLISMLRGTVVRDKYSREILHKSFTELGTRISKQLHKLVLGVGIFRGVEEVGEHEYRIACHVARGSVPQRLWDTAEVVYKHLGGVSPGQASKLIGLPISTITMVLDNLCMLGALEHHIDVTVNKSVYVVRREVRELFDTTKAFSKL